MAATEGAGRFGASIRARQARRSCTTSAAGGSARSWRRGATAAADHEDRPRGQPGPRRGRPVRVRIDERGERRAARQPCARGARRRLPPSSRPQPRRHRRSRRSRISAESRTQLVQRLACVHEPPRYCLDGGELLRKPSWGPFPKFFADRGTHLAAMIAYFALVSFVPLTFLALALLGLAHRVTSRATSSRAAADLPVAVDRRHRGDGAVGPAQRGDARHRRRRPPALELALALQCARVGVQHRLRAAEPAVRPRQADRRRRSW